MTADVVIRNSVQEYYGKVLKNSKDLKSNACCSVESFSPRHREILKLIDEEIISKLTWEEGLELLKT